MPDSNIHIGDKYVKATGNVEIAAQGERAVLTATGDDGLALVQAGKLVMAQSGAAFLTIAGGTETGDITLQSSPTGSITIALGPMLVGPCIKLSTEKIELTVGPPGVGASLTMTPASIAVKLGVASMELTPASLALAAAESKLNLTPASASMSSLDCSVSGMVGATVKGTATAEFSAAGQTSVKGAICMIN
jgi:type VI secretion system secreted protein VgrG